MKAELERAFAPLDPLVLAWCGVCGLDMLCQVNRFRHDQVSPLRFSVEFGISGVVVGTSLCGALLGPVGIALQCLAALIGLLGLYARKIYEPIHPEERGRLY